MFNHRLTRAAAIAVAIAATAAPTASADDHWRTQPAPPQDLRSPDTRDAAQHRGLYQPIRPQDQPQPPQDLRNPDTRDFADGRGTYNAPEVVVVKAPPVAQPTATGIDWAGVGSAPADPGREPDRPRRHPADRAAARRARTNRP